MAGELLGLDAIATGRHDCDAVALDTSDICETPFDNLRELMVSMPSLLDQFHRTLSQEIQRQQASLFFLGNARAEQRLALFLLNLSGRYAQRGYSATSFQLRMSREDIGGYLGLTVESVSRQLARLKSDGLIALNNRDLRILDRSRLEALSSGMPVAEAACAA
jgi:CRP/FNR family transcriptional regulator